MTIEYTNYYTEYATTDKIHYVPKFKPVDRQMKTKRYKRCNYQPKMKGRSFLRTVLCSCIDKFLGLP